MQQRSSFTLFHFSHFTFMIQLFRKGWFQVVFFGVLIGGALIVLDTQFNWFRKDDGAPRRYQGTVEANTKDIYFTRAEYSAFTYNFGDVPEGDTVSTIFNIKNTGSEPLYIFKVSGSCDCVAAFYDSDPIQPGKQQPIQVRFSTRGRKGKQERKIHVTTNTEPSEAVLVLVGNVQ